MRHINFLYPLFFVLSPLSGFAQTYLTSYDPNPQNPFQADIGKYVWSIGKYIYINNGYIDNGGGRRDDILQIDADTRLLVRQLPLDGPQGDLATSAMCVTSDGNMLLSGEWYDYDAKRIRLFVMKLRPDLETVWANFYPDLNDKSFYSDGIVEIPDSNQYLVYLSEGTDPAPHNDGELRILKLDSVGNVLWGRMLQDTMWRAFGGGDLTATDDGHFLVSSRVHNLYEDPVTHITYFRNSIVHKIDAEANQVYTNAVGYTQWDYQLPFSQATSDGGGVVMSIKDTFTLDPTIRNSFPVMYAFDAKGKRTWEREWNKKSYWEVSDLALTADGDLLGAGRYCRSFPKALLFRLKKDGTLRWERVYSDSLLRPWSNNFNLISIYELADGRIALTGFVGDSTTIKGGLNLNVALLVVDAEGCLEPGCGNGVQYVTATNMLLLKHSMPALQSSPNPTPGPVTLKLPEGLAAGSGAYALRCYTATGRLVWAQPWPPEASELHLSTESWPAGSYFLTLYERNQQVAMGKVEVQH